MEEKILSKVFIVHGHDEAAKHAVTRFVEKLGLEAIILDEQPSEGLTIIDKFEEYADEAGFAIVLLTHDDVGSSKATGKRKPRARQDVIFELGYFFRGLGSKRVCALYKEGVELISDIPGLVYVSMDSENAWQLKLEQEMRNVGLPVNPNKLLQNR